MKTSKKWGRYSQSYALTLVLVPSVISVIILLVGNNIAWAFSLAGVFSIIRFRSAAADPKDIAYLLFGTAAGLACGAGSYGYAALFTIILCALMVVLSLTKFGATQSSERLLKIVIPEDLDYPNVFDEVFAQYTTDFCLKKVRTTDLGSLFELVYTVVLPNQINQKEFMDAIRCRNGNLNVTLSMSPEADF